MPTDDEYRLSQMFGPSGEFLVGTTGPNLFLQERETAVANDKADHMRKIHVHNSNYELKIDTYTRWFETFVISKGGLSVSRRVAGAATRSTKM